MYSSTEFPVLVLVCSVLAPALQSLGDAGVKCVSDVSRQEHEDLSSLHNHASGYTDLAFF